MVAGGLLYMANPKISLISPIFVQGRFDYALGLPQKKRATVPGPV